MNLLFANQFYRSVTFVILREAILTELFERKAIFLQINNEYANNSMNCSPFRRGKGSQDPGARISL